MLLVIYSFQQAEIATVWNTLVWRDDADECGWLGLTIAGLRGNGSGESREAGRWLACFG